MISLIFNYKISFFYMFMFKYVDATKSRDPLPTRMLERGLGSLVFYLY